MTDILRKPGESISDLDREMESAFDEYVRTVKRGVLSAASLASMMAGDLYEALSERSEAVRKLEKRLTGILGKAVDRGTGDVESLLPVSFSLKNDKALTWIEQHSLQMASYMDRTSRDAVRRYLAMAITQGIDQKAIQKELAGVVPLHRNQAIALAKYRETVADRSDVDRLVAARAARMSKHRAELIARTEIISAHARGTIDGWNEAMANGLLPATSVKVWITAPDERRCIICAGLEGTKSAITGHFPGGYFAPSAHPMCRCAMGFEVVSAAEYAVISARSGAPRLTPSLFGAAA